MSVPDPTRTREFIFAGDSGSWELDEFDEHPLIVEVILNTLGTWQRARPEDGIEDGAKMGYWADGFEEPVIRSGSRLWLVRGKKDQLSLNRIVDAIREALAPVIADGLAQSIDVSGEIGSSPDMSQVVIVTTQPDGFETLLRFQDVWKNDFFFAEE